MDSRNNIIETLKEFQEGYIQRDISNVKEFVNKLYDEEALVIGSVAAFLGGFEWCQGREQIKQLITNDWIGWGDLRIDFENSIINNTNDFAWVALTGTLSTTYKAENLHNNCLQQIKAIVNNDESDKIKLLEIMQKTSDVLFECERGDKYIWPIRITAVLIKNEEKWVFKHMNLSFPMPRPPVYRIIK